MFFKLGQNNFFGGFYYPFWAFIGVTNTYNRLSQQQPAGFYIEEVTMPKGMLKLTGPKKSEVDGRTN